MHHQPNPIPTPELALSQWPISLSHVSRQPETRCHPRHQSPLFNSLALKGVGGTSELLGGPPFSLESSGIPQVSQPQAELTSPPEIWVQRGGRGGVYLANPKSGLAGLCLWGRVPTGY